MEELFEQLKKEGKCCICEKPLTDTQYMNMLELQVAVPWDGPTWGNLISGEQGMGVAYTCDACYELGLLKGNDPVRFAVEWTQKKFTFHPVLCIGEKHVLVTTN